MRELSHIQKMDQFEKETAHLDDVEYIKALHNRLVEVGERVKRNNEKRKKIYNQIMEANPHLKNI